jgi:hypothetical protein
LIAVVVLVGALAHAARAGAEDEPSRPVLLTVDPGLCLPGNHLTAGGDVGIPPPYYIGVDLQVHLHGPFDLGLSAGLGFQLGGLLGATARLATPWQDGFRFTLGAGPMMVTGASFGTAAFVQADAAIELRSSAGFAFIIGPAIAVAVSHAGTAACGVDTCQGYVTPGDRLYLLRAGIGFNI